jgi:hypothetical protein
MTRRTEEGGVDLCHQHPCYPIEIQWLEHQASVLLLVYLEARIPKIDNNPSRESRREIIGQKETMISEVFGFPLFSKLPTEIRAMIWTMSFVSKSGRMVEVRNHQVRHLKVDNFDRNGNPRLHLWSPSPPPDLVNVCHEARDVAKQVAMRAGQFIFQRIFFDPTIDTLYAPQTKDNIPAQIEEDPYSAT